VKQIAAQEGIPAHFLAKDLQQLARRACCVEQGPTGGFMLRTSRKRSRWSIEGGAGRPHDFPEVRERPGGVAPTTRHARCDSWTVLRSRIMDYLEQTDIADLASALEFEARRWINRAKREGRCRQEVARLGLERAPNEKLLCWSPWS